MKGGRYSKPSASRRRSPQSHKLTPADGARGGLTRALNIWRRKHEEAVAEHEETRAQLLEREAELARVRRSIESGEAQAAERVVPSWQRPPAQQDPAAGSSHSPLPELEPEPEQVAGASRPMTAIEREEVRRRRDADPGRMSEFERWGLEQEAKRELARERERYTRPDPGVRYSWDGH